MTWLHLDEFAFSEIYDENKVKDGRKLAKFGNYLQLDSGLDLLPYRARREAGRATKSV